MTRYSVQPRDRILVKGYRFLYLDINKKLGSKYSQKRPDHANHSATGALKNASKRAIEETANAISHLIGYKNAIKITRVSKTYPKIIKK